MYNYPFIGLACWYSGLGGTKPLGSAIAVFPYINFPLLRTENFNLYFRTGAGLGYLTRKYDRYDNYGWHRQDCRWSIFQTGPSGSPITG